MPDNRDKYKAKTPPQGVRAQLAGGESTGGWEEDTPIHQPSAPGSQSARAAMREINSLRAEFAEHSREDKEAIEKLEKKIDDRHDKLDAKFDDKVGEVVDSNARLGREVSELSGTLRTFMENSKTDELKRAVTETGHGRSRRDSTTDVAKKKWTLLEKIVGGVFAVLVVLVPILANKC